MKPIIHFFFVFVSITISLTVLVLYIKQDRLIESQSHSIQKQNEELQIQLNQKTKKLQTQLNQQNTKLQKLIDQQIIERKRAKRTRLIDILYQEREAQSGSIPVFLKNHSTSRKPRLPKANLRSRREAVIEFIKLEREAGKKIDLSSAFLSNVDLSNKKLKEYKLVGALKGAKFNGAHLEGVDFSDTNLEGATFLGANLESARFFGANLIDANLRATNLEGGMFFETRLAGAKFHGAYLKLAIFYGAFLDGAVVNSAQWIEDYHKMNPRLRTFRLDQYSLIEGKDENGDRIYFINGPDPALKAKKPKL